MQREMFHDRKFMAELEAAGKAPEPGAGGDLGGDLGDIGGDLGGDLGDLGAPTPAPATPADTGADTPPVDDVLLAEPPGKRDDRPATRGPYQRHQHSYKKGGLKKQMSSQSTGEIGTPRITFPGKVGRSGLDSFIKPSLGRGVVESQSHDILEETKLFTTSNDLKNLIESLTKEEQDEA